MHELGELANHQPEFERRGVRLIVASVDGPDDTGKTQAQFPKLLVLSDADRQLTQAAHAIHAGAGPDQSDIAAPTTFLLDAGGKVRWSYRPDRVMVRLTPAELLAEVDRHLGK